VAPDLLLILDGWVGEEVMVVALTYALSAHQGANAFGAGE
jgi:hypothetical protein